MTRVVLIRPGSTDYDEQNRIQGVLDLPLSSRGVTEAAQTAEELRQTPLGAIYSARGESSRATAKTIAHALKLRVRRLDKLHNLDQGLWQGLQVDEVRRKHPRVYKQWCESPTTVCPPNGETVQAAYERVCKVLRPLLKQHRDQTIGIVVPEPIASVVGCYLTQRDLSRLWEAPESQNRWQVVDVVPEGNSQPSKP